VLTASPIHCVARSRGVSRLTSLVATFRYLSQIGLVT
jgi:hypothetical protein